VKLTSLICELFQKEKSFTWFKAHPRNYDGKLYSTYRTWRKNCVKAGIAIKDDVVQEHALNLGMFNIILNIQ
jgi:hypothetical protein